MNSLLYVSKPMPDLDSSAVDAILESALRNNPSQGLTGMLLWSETSFAQLLEGPNEAIETLLNKLKADGRHREMRVLSRTATSRRFFGDWSMASRRMAPELDWRLLEQEDAICAVELLHLMTACRSCAFASAPRACLPQPPCFEGRPPSGPLYAGSPS